jgi:signal transduction histidine kinase
MKVVPVAVEETVRTITGQLAEGERFPPPAWGRRDTWQVRLRWWVPPAIVFSLWVGRSLGFEVEVAPIVAVAVFVFSYNVIFASIFRRSRGLVDDASVERRYAALQVSLDYASMFVLIHFTGGAASPLIFFFILHVIIAAILFRSRYAWFFAVAAVGGLGLLAAGESVGWLGHHPVRFGGEAATLAPGHATALLVFFAASVFAAAALTAAIMRRLRRGVRNLAEASEEVAALNKKLNSLYTMLCAIGSEHRLDRTLEMVTSELSKVLGVRGVAVKLLSEDGKTLRFAAAHGLPSGFSEEKTVEVAKSRLNRKVIEGETIVFGQVARDRQFQLQDDLLEAGIQSVVFTPLELEDRVIGILGAYCGKPERFCSGDTAFLRLAAELVAVAIENARAYEAVENLMQERSRFMLRVAHNMRAPLSAGLSMLEAVEGGYLGEIRKEQAAHLNRVGFRLRTLNTAVGQLLTLAQNRQGAQALRRGPVDIVSIARRLESTFRDEADQKDLRFRVSVPEDLLEIDGDAEMIEQMLENLISNALKYTASGGQVDVGFREIENQRVRIEVRDTGIGIPREERSQLFEEFFRASNASKVEEIGTGLGLAIVKQIVERHGGSINVESEEGKGTAFLVDLPTTP